MTAARQAIAARNGIAAAARLNQVLSLPPNTQTEAAQALMGEAREFSGELRKAKTEYELYLKLYPKGEFVPRVTDRLAGVDKTITQLSPSLGLKPGAGPAPWTVFGSISQNYYTGNSQIVTITPPPPGQLLFNQDTLSLTDQRSLISTLDFQARRNDAVTDTRIVIRELDNRNYLQGQKSYDRLNAAYIDQTNKQVGYNFRVGRQLGTGGGVFGRFDGLLLGYSLNPTWRINAVVGTPVEFNTPFSRSFAGASVDFSPKTGRPGFTGYYIEQTLEGVLDRKAVGGEVRYFDPHTTVFGMVDYDLLYDQVNIAMMQGNRRTDAGTNYFVNVDYRKTPPLGFTNALPGQISLDPARPTLDFRQLFRTSVDTLGVDELRNQASILTGNSSLYTVGFLHPVTTHWQLGADYRNASVTGTGESGILPAQPGTGTSHVFSGQALGSSLLFTNDTTVVNGTFIFAPTFDGQSYTFTYVVPYNNWRFDGIVGYYTQRDFQSQRQVRWTPTLKISYRWRTSTTFELQAGAEIFDETGPLRELHSRRQYIYGGYRWDFQ